MLIDPNVAHLQAGAFQGAALTGVSMLPDVIQIGEIESNSIGAFQGCVNLSSVVLSSSLQKLGSSTFRGCLSLSFVDLPDTITYSGEGIFAYSGISNFDMPVSAPLIPANMFRGCAKLKSVNLRPYVSMQKIEAFAFFDCTALTYLALPTSIQQIDSDAFGNDLIAPCNSPMHTIAPDFNTAETVFESTKYSCTIAFTGK